MSEHDILFQHIEMLIFIANGTDFQIVKI